MPSDKPAIRESDRIDVTHDYAMCAWARHFNVSEKQVREAVAAVGDRAVSVSAHLSSHGGARVDGRARSERPGSY